MQVFFGTINRPIRTEQEVGSSGQDSDGHAWKQRMGFSVNNEKELLKFYYDIKVIKIIF